MRCDLSILEPATGEAVHVQLTASPATPIEDVARSLQPYQVAEGPLLLDGEPLSNGRTLAESGLRDGSVLTIGRSVGRVWDDLQPGALELWVVGGPAAGYRFPLGQSVLIGRAEEAQLRLPDPEVSRRHAQITWTDGAATIEDLGSTLGTWFEGERIDAPATLRPGDVVRLGSSYLCLVQIPRERAAVAPGGEGELVFNRTYRLAEPDDRVELVMPREPAEREPRRFPVAAMVAPAIFAVVMLLVFQRAYFLVFALLSPAMALANFISDRRQTRRTTAKERERYEAELAAFESALSAEAQRQTTRLRTTLPDPATAAYMATVPGTRLWERRITDDDFLNVRVGIGNVSADVAIRGEPGHEPPVPTLHDVPVGFNLRSAGVAGIAGDEPRRNALARWVALQLAVLHAPNDLRLALVSRRALERDWGFLRWLPHTKARSGGPCLVANEEETAAALVDALVENLRQRRESSRERRGEDGIASPAYVVLLDGSREFREVPGIRELLTEGPASGFFVVCLDDEPELLAEECRAVATFPDADRPVVLAREDRGGSHDEVVADLVASPLCDEAGRGMAPLQLAGEEGAGGLPAQLRLLDVLDLEPPTPESLVARWSLGGCTTRATFGRTEDGTFVLDIARDGPHALVAGTTGSGKSEFLKSWIASLAVVNRPDELNFLLVDYKGGGDLGLCARLPHCVGLVTNLDEHLTRRAIESLSAERERRQQLCSSVGAANIEGYWTARERDPTLEPLPRLMIVVDEFAQLKSELPEFIDNLVEVARLGRAHGIHLVLATQRPSGTVSPEILANTDLRIALRVAAGPDSDDIIESPVAASIPKSIATAGEGYARVGSNQLVHFKAGRIGGPRPGAVVEDEPLEIRAIAWEGLLAAGTGSDEAGPTAEVPDEETDLFMLVEAALDAAAAEDAAPPKRPWLDALPDVVVLDDLWDDERTQDSRAPFGLLDLPARQAQVPATFWFDGKHLGVIGSAQSGRSTTLRAIAIAAARCLGPDELHLYGIDCGNGALLGLGGLPHSGPVITRGEPERVARLVARLGDEVIRRQGVLTAAGYANVSEQRASAPEGERLPYILLLIDRWEGFVDVFRDYSVGAVEEGIYRLLAESPGVGVHAVIAGDRSLLSGRVAPLLSSRLVHRMNDPDDYTWAGLSTRDIPEHMPPGRGFLDSVDQEVQVALLSSDVSGTAQNAALQRITEDLANQFSAPATTPIRVDALPVSISLADARSLGEPPPGARASVLAGVGGDILATRWVDLAEVGGKFLIAGPPKSGRSTAVTTVAACLADAGYELVLITPKRSPLQGLHDQRFVKTALTGIDAQDPDFEEFLAADRLAVIIDDADLTSIDNQQLRSLADDRSPDRVLVVAGSTEPLRTQLGFVAAVRNARTGLLLSPQSTLDGSVIGASLSRGNEFAGPPGRAVLSVLGETTLVQVPIFSLPP